MSAMPGGGSPGSAPIALSSFGLGPSPRRTPSTDAAWQALYHAACAPYRRGGHFAWHFARGKLRRDPVFRALLERGELSGCRRVVDIGCGQGLVCSLLQACHDLAQGGHWPAGWPAPPAATAYTGIELMPRDIARAERSMAGVALPHRFVLGDMREAELPACDLVFILDVLHYVDHAAQAAVLQRVHAALQPHGRLLLRVGDRASRRRFAISQWADRLITTVRGHRVPPTWGRSVAEWTAVLESVGFAVHAVPMSAGTPFANVLLVADVQDGER
jgi:SAM-dependent methyltransferase